MQTTKGIILYDFLQVRGGAEQVSLQLAKMFQATLCIGYANKQLISSLTSLHVHELNTSSFIYPLTLLKTLYAFQHHTNFITDYQWAIFSGFYAPSAIIKHRARHNILYCHTIPRFAYDLRDWYLARSPFWQRPLLTQFIDHIQRHYEPAVAQMDTVIANSYNVANRLQKYLGCTAQVIHPPCQIQYFHWLSQGDYYLSLARLEDYKRIDLIIKAFKQMPDKKLLIASGGASEQHLRQLAAGADNITFTGWISKARLRELIGHAIATIYIPIDEDFGLSPVESMAAGKPVIGVAEGGLLETIVDEITGVLLPANPSTDDVINAVINLTPQRALAMKIDCQEQAQQFSATLFKQRIAQVLQ